MLNDFPHIHEVVSVHPVNEVLGWIDNKALRVTFPKVIHKNFKKLGSGFHLTGDATNNGAVENDLFTPTLCSCHLSDDTLGFFLEILL